MFDWVLNTPSNAILYKAHLQKMWTLRKSGYYARIHHIGQKHLNEKLEVTDFKYDNNFSLKLQPKNT